MTVDDLIGKKLGGYEILDRIGQGGMATVYRARQTSMNRVVALKVLPKHLMRDDTYLTRFKREVDIVAQLEHRSIVPVHDYGDDDGQPYIAMRYMPAGSVDDKVKHGALSLDDILLIIQQIAPALDYAHSKNVLHRDLKPSNILMDDDGGAYITDFGIARIVGTEAKGSTITTQGVVGTPSYMSPEQAQGHKLDGRSDVYSLGVMLFEMATGRRPFENETPYGVAVMQVTAQPPNPRNINPNLPPAIEDVILKSLKKKPDNRFQTALELAQALEVAIQNPDAKRQTEEHPNPSLEVTQPSGVFNADFTVPASPAPVAPVSPPPMPPTYPQPIRTPPPISQASAGMQGVDSRVIKRYKGRPRARPRKKNNGLFISLTIGGLLGCAILTALTVALGMLAQDILQRNRTGPATMVMTPIPTLDEQQRATLVGSAAIIGGDNLTPVFANVTPIPTVQQPSPQQTLIGTAQAVGQAPGQAPALPTDFDRTHTRMVYFAAPGGIANSAGRYDLFLHDVLTGERTRLTQDSGDNTHPAISPDGQTIAFQSNRNGDWDIYLLDVASQESVLLLNTPTDEYAPAWSPDGAYVVFASDTRGDGTYDLFRMASDGSGSPELIYSDGARNNHARYSPDGRTLTFVNGSPTDARTWRILTFDFGDGTVNAITQNNVRDAYPSFTPDGTGILYVTEGNDGGTRIVRIRADGNGQPRTLYSSVGFVWGMHYSPDGRFITFHEETGATPVIMLMRADGNEARTLTGMSGYSPIWLP